MYVRLHSVGGHWERKWRAADALNKKRQVSAVGENAERREAATTKQQAAK